MNNTDFIFGLSQTIFGHLSTETAVKTGEYLFLEPRIFSLARWHFEARHQFFFALLKLHIATLGDGQSVVAGFWVVLEKLAHLGGRL